MLAKLQQKLAEIRANEEKGMSLTELVVVVAILAILVAIAVPVYLSIQDDARNQSVKTTLANALTVYQYESGRTSGTPGTAVRNLGTAELAITTIPATGDALTCIVGALGTSTWSVDTATGVYSNNATCA